jgi:hypothetical protein
MAHLTSKNHLRCFDYQVFSCTKLIWIKAYFVAPAGAVGALSARASRDPGTSPLAVVLEPGDWDKRVTSAGRPLGAPDHGWAWVYNPLAVRETVAWLRTHSAVSVPDSVRTMVETATHADYLEARAKLRKALGGALATPLWQRNCRQPASLCGISRPSAGV